MMEDEGENNNLFLFFVPQPITAPIVSNKMMYHLDGHVLHNQCPFTHPEILQIQRRN